MVRGSSSKRKSDPVPVAVRPPVHRFHRSVLRWYAAHGRSFPWRRTTDPYRILLSEIMAQQTQVSRVAFYYRQWLKRFPTISALAAAPAGDVLREWSGLGYNSRALRFHKLANEVITNHRSRLPKDVGALQQLPGIGRYTAHAVCCFAFGQRVPVVDVNIRRILTRWTRRVRSSNEQMTDEAAWTQAEHFLPKQRSYDWNQALMDLGATICTARAPKCGECPVVSLCASAGTPALQKQSASTKKKEPLWRGEPRRLYRGRILKLLHHHQLEPEMVASQLWKDAARKDAEWVSILLERMVTDGLLSKRGRSYRLVEG